MIFDQPFVQQILNIDTLSYYVPLCLIFIISVSYIAGYLKLNRNIKTNYTRKLFHISIFSFAGFIALFGSFAGVCIFGGISTLFTLAVLYKGDGNIFYEGVAREEDSPHRSLYIILPLIATIIGGLLGQFVFGKFAVIGYFLVGFGDAVGEPIGVRFGKHIYKIPTFTRRIFIRTLEGSMGVLLASTVVSLVILLFILGLSPVMALLCALVIGACACAVEAISPHGFDNFTVQFFPLIGGYVIIYYLF
jgi:phytol kinase